MANFGLGHYITYHTVVLDLLTQKNVNIYDFIIANSSWDTSSKKLKAVIRIPPNNTIYSTDPLLPAITIPNSFRSYDLIIIKNEGTIAGAGGAGGRGGFISGGTPIEGENGINGGTAIYTRKNTYLYNSGYIYGGGGGGGGGGCGQETYTVGSNIVCQCCETGGCDTCPYDCRNFWYNTRDYHCYTSTTNQCTVYCVQPCCDPARVVPGYYVECKNKTWTDNKGGTGGNGQTENGSTPWAAGTQYSIGEKVQQGGIFYTCYTAHISPSVFSIYGPGSPAQLYWTVLTTTNGSAGIISGGNGGNGGTWGQPGTNGTAGSITIGGLGGSGGCWVNGYEYLDIRKTNVELGGNCTAFIQPTQTPKPTPTPIPPPTYSLTRSAASVNEGQSVTFTLNTTNVTNGTSIPYSISGVTSNDISNAPLNSFFTINNNTASKTLTLTNDETEEGNETLIITTINGISKSVLINDTSVPLTSPTPLISQARVWAAGANGNTWNFWYRLGGAAPQYNGIWVNILDLRPNLWIDLFNGIPKTVTLFGTGREVIHKVKNSPTGAEVTICSFGNNSGPTNGTNGTVDNKALYDSAQYKTITLNANGDLYIKSSLTDYDGDSDYEGGWIHAISCTPY